MLRVAVCDDDISFLESFPELITRAFAHAGQEITVVTFQEGKSLIDAVEKEKQLFDIVFLDVEMPGVHGFQVAQRLRELSAAIILIFTTYMEHQSREGYRYGAFRYVFKNNLEAEIDEAVSGILKKLGASELGQEEMAFKYRNSGVLERLIIKKADIIYLQAKRSRRVSLRTVCSEYDLVIKPLSEYAQQLPEPIFVPIMRDYLLNCNHVISVQDGFFQLTGGLKLPLGVKREVRKASMEKYLRFLEGRI